MRELRARADAQLSVHAAEVILDRLRTEEHRCGGLACRAALRQQERDLQLLRCQLVERRRVSLARLLARRLELRTGEIRPRRCTKRVERFERRTPLFPSALS